MKTSPTFVLSLIASTLLLVPSAKADYVYPMHVERGSNRVTEALATKVNDTQFITDAELVVGVDKVFLLDRSVTPEVESFGHRELCRSQTTHRGVNCK